MKTNLYAAALLVVFGSTCAHAVGVKAKWTEWEEANSVAQEGDWLVVRQPDKGFCYLVQNSGDGYDNVWVARMKADGIPTFVIPPLQGLPKDVSYRVDGGPVENVQKRNIDSLAVKLPASAVPAMKRGRMMTVWINIPGEPLVELNVGLDGFTAAASWLGSKECRRKVPDQYQLEGNALPPATED
jgi:invasion protein IalB